MSDLIERAKQESIGLHQWAEMAGGESAHVTAALIDDLIAELERKDKVIARIAKGDFHPKRTGDHSLPGTSFEDRLTMEIEAIQKYAKENRHG